MTKQLLEQIRERRQTERVHDRRATDLLAAGRYVPAEVIDPYASNDKIVVMRQTRGDPLARLHSHRQINDAQFHAGRDYQNDREIAERGARAIDPTKEAVDGGLLPEALTERQVKARRRLVKIKTELGRRLVAVLDDVLIEGKTIEQIAQTRMQSVLKLHGGLFRVALNELALIYGYSNAGVGSVEEAE